MAQLAAITAATAAVPYAVEGAEALGSKIASSGVGREVIEGGENAMSKVLPTLKNTGKKALSYVKNIGGKLIGKTTPAEVAPAREVGGAASIPKNTIKPKPIETKPIVQPKPIETKPIVQPKPQIKPIEAPKAVEAPRESFKKKAAEALLLGGLVPGVGFTLAGNLVGQPSSQQNPDITNGDLAKAHQEANGDYDALQNYQFDNGKTFGDVQKDFIKGNKKKLHETVGNQKKLYTKSGNMTKIHQSARLHGIDLSSS